MVVNKSIKKGGGVAKLKMVKGLRKQQQQQTS